MGYKLSLGVLLLLYSCSNNGNKAAVSENTTQAEVTVAKAASSIAGATGNWKTYCNQRYGYCIDYDTALMDAQPEADAGDGRIFLDKSGKELLRVYWRNNNDPDIEASSPSEEMEAAYMEFLEHSGDSGNPTSVYKTTGKGFAVFSGAKNGMIYYTKIFDIGDGLVFVKFQYVAKDKEKYDKVVTHIAASFIKTEANGH